MDESLIREQEAQLQKTGRYYKHICFMAVPVLWMACFLYGVRPLLLCGIAVLTGNLCDRLVSLLRRRVYQAGDFSNESFALVIALLMPVTVDIYVLIIAVLAGVLIGKEIFGGYGSYPFNPAAVGYVVAAVSWPEQVLRYPQPYTSIPLWDASMVPVSSTIEDTLRSGGMLNIRSLVLSLGEYAAPMGTGAALVILACGLFLWTQKDAHMSASVSFLLTCALIAFLFPRQAGLADSAVLANILPRLRCVRDELLTGAILFSAVFLLNEPYTCVHHRMGRILYGVLVGVVSPQEWTIAPVPAYKEYKNPKDGKSDEVKTRGKQANHSHLLSAAIRKNSEMKAQAEIFLNWLVTEGQKLLAKDGYGSVNSDYESEVLAATNRAKNTAALLSSNKNSKKGDWAYLTDRIWIDVWAIPLNSNVRNGSMSLKDWFSGYVTETNNALAGYKK